MAKMMNVIERGRPWPEQLQKARAGFLPKDLDDMLASPPNVSLDVQDVVEDETETPPAVRRQLEDGRNVRRSRRPRSR